MGLFLHSEPQKKNYKVMHYGPSTSKVIKTGTNQKPISDFLSIFHCNYMQLISQKSVFRCFTHSSLILSLHKTGSFLNIALKAVVFNWLYLLHL